MTSKDEQLLMEAYKMVAKKTASCNCGEECECKNNKDSKPNNKTKAKKAPFKPKKEMEESSASSFKALFKKVISEKRA